MKKALVLLALTLVSCNCGGASVTSTEHVKGPDRPPGLSLNRREMGFELLSYIKDRTVHVTKDCGPKEGVTVVLVGTKVNPQTFLDGRGTGVILKSGIGGSYIATAYHVVTTDKQYKAAFSCKFHIALSGALDKKITAVIVAHDEKRDLAILKVLPNLGLSTFVEYDSRFGVDTVGETVYVAGYPQIFADNKVYLSVTRGVLATVNVSPNNSAVDSGLFHRIDAQIYFGSSGGGVWNEDGDLVGLVDVIFAHDVEDGYSVPYDGQYYIKPAHELEYVANDKKLFGVVVHN
jgi:S1-C subfamily serine protease